MLVKKIRKWKLDAMSLEHWFKFFEDLLAALATRRSTGGKVLGGPSLVRNAQLVDEAIDGLIGGEKVRKNLLTTGDKNLKSSLSSSENNPNMPSATLTALERMRKDKIQTEKTRDEILLAVQGLVEFENRILQTKKFFAEVDVDLQSSQDLVMKIVRHFMQLFDVKELEGVLPAMNTVFARLHELKNFWKTLCVELRVDANLPPSKILERLASEQRSKSAGFLGGGLTGRGEDHEQADYTTPTSAA
ncbi:unnamed protein product [Amoebophrya sp. A120]|nr:unnamed protein product [Amoebophrya sp. A120]|eukprot:GSA120T00000322001.1